jgi:hypothetical protein
MKRFLQFLIIAATLACASLCDAAEPVPINLYLTDAAGNAISGAVDMSFCYFALDKKISCETRTNLLASNGSIQVALRPPTRTHLMLEVGVKFGANFETLEPHFSFDVLDVRKILDRLQPAPSGNCHESH